MRRGKILGLAAGGLFAAYVLAGPYLTLYYIKQAAEQRDSKTLSGYIDFPSVRQSFKDDLNVKLGDQMAADDSNPFAAMGAALGNAMVDQMLASYISPEGVTALMAGGPSALHQPSAPAAMPDNANAATEQVTIFPLLTYSSPHNATVNFLVNGTDIGYRVSLRRDGFFGWKVNGLVLGMD